MLKLSLFHLNVWSFFHIPMLNVFFFFFLFQPDRALPNVPENGITGSVPPHLPSLCPVPAFPTTVRHVPVQLSGLLEAPLQPVGEDPDFHANNQAFHRSRQVASAADHSFERSWDPERPVSFFVTRWITFIFVSVQTMDYRCQDLKGKLVWYEATSVTPNWSWFLLTLLEWTLIITIKITNCLARRYI